MDAPRVNSSARHSRLQSFVLLERRRRRIRVAAADDTHLYARTQALEIYADHARRVVDDAAAPAARDNRQHPGRKGAYQGSARSALCTICARRCILGRTDPRVGLYPKRPCRHHPFQPHTLGRTPERFGALSGGGAIGTQFARRSQRFPRTSMKFTPQSIVNSQGLVQCLRNN